ncbi:MAG: rhodanese-like domain-containing protein [Bacteroidales bacterium]|nr:rhodanese-like domain-containing protein [Bacteroidales bacterium]
MSEYGDFCHDEFPDVKQISATELYEKMKTEKYLLIDIREPELFEQYHIDGQNQTIEQILEHQELVPFDKNVVLICENGSNSMAIIEELEKDPKFERLFNLKGGIQDWIAQKLPLISK